MKKTEQIYLYFDYNIDFPKSKDFFRYFSKTDKKYFRFRKFFQKNVLTFSKSGVIIETQRNKTSREAVHMNAYNAYGYRENAMARRNRSAFGTMRRFLRAVFAVIGERLNSPEARVAEVIGSFVVALGLIGGMESGAVPLYIGLPVCLVLAAAGLLTHFED